MQVKILSWNIWFNCDVDLVRDFLSKCNADIIGLQEVVSNEKSREIIGFMESLGYKHYYAMAKRLEDGREFGNAIFSKYPLENTKVNILTESENRKIAVSADVKVDGKSLHVYSVHLLHTHQTVSEEQVNQAKILSTLLPKQNTIVMGDFNSVPQFETIKQLEKVVVNTDPMNIPTWCVYPEGCPTCDLKTVSIKLDYIFVSREMKFDLFKVELAKGSDHLPISINLEL